LSASGTEHKTGQKGQTTHDSGFNAPKPSPPSSLYPNATPRHCIELNGIGALKAINASRLAMRETGPSALGFISG